jgi:hypothetical protein
MTRFYVSVLILAVLLFYHTSKLIWVVSVRRLQRKLQRELTEEELQGQQKRARLLTVPVVLTFSWLFNFNVFGYPDSG